VHGLLSQLGQQSDLTLHPEYYLLTLPPARRVDVLIISTQATLLAVLYGQRRCLGPWRTGFLTGGDAVGCGGLLSAPEMLLPALHQAASFYLHRDVHAMRWKLALPPDAPGIPEQLPEHLLGIGVRQAVSESDPPGDILMLASTYDAFLARLSKLTRRNLRYYRRQADAAGYRFERGVPFQDYARRLQALGPVLRHPVSAWRLQGQAAMLDQFGGECAGLRSPDGVLEAGLCGFVREGRFHLLARYVNPDLARQSLALVLCGYLIEELVAQGCRELRFLNGALFPFRRYCQARRLLELDLDRPRAILTPLKWVCGRTAQARIAQRGSWERALRRIAGTYGRERG